MLWVLIIGIVGAAAAGPVLAFFQEWLREHHAAMRDAGLEADPPPWFSDLWS